MKQFCMKIDLISQGRQNVLFLPTNMVAMTSRENALLDQAKLAYVIRSQVNLYTQEVQAPERNSPKSAETQRKEYTRLQVSLFQ